MRMFGLFGKREMDHSQKVEAAYRRCNADERKNFFPEGVHQADIIIRSLAKIYGVSLDELDENAYHEILTSYTEAIIRKALPGSDDEVIVRGFQVRHGSLVRTIEMARRAFTYTMLNRLDRSFAIESEEDMLFLCKVARSEDEKTSPKQDDMFVSEYCFEGPLEHAIYGKLYGTDDGFICWSSGNQYREQYRKGFRLVEEGKYEEAIAAYRASLEFNPIGISARFEICECFIRLKDFYSAKETLYAMTPYLLEPKHLAKFYRRLGYIAVEQGNDLCAAGCFVYSKNFEQNPGTEQELQNIFAKTGVQPSQIVGDPTIYLERYHIPVLKERKLSEL
ncbi:hypothetical protein B5G38_02815 [Gemmiger sp. An87]|nr:hypothetical protein B5G38_02815 [Gemmiger sp. An87]